MAASLAVVGGRDAILCSALKGEFERGGGPAQSPFASAAVSFPRGRGPSVRAAFASTFKWGASSNVGGGQTAVFLPCRPQRKIVSSRPLSVVAAGTIERSYIMIKPDGVQRGIVGEIISRFERKGFTLKGLKLFQTPKELAEEHYGELKEKPFFPNLVKYILSGPVVAMVWEGPGIVAAARKLIGVTNPLNAEPGTIRGDFGVNTGRNVIHGSDSPENGEREIALWFKEGEVIKWEPALTPWILE